MDGIAQPGLVGRNEPASLFPRLSPAGGELGSQTSADARRSYFTPSLAVKEDEVITAPEWQPRRLRGKGRELSDRVCFVAVTSRQRERNFYLHRGAKKWVFKASGKCITRAKDKGNKEVFKSIKLQNLLLTNVAKSFSGALRC